VKILSEKYLIMSKENSFQIQIRNTLGPLGYQFLHSCTDVNALTKLIRSYEPSFVIVDGSIHKTDFTAIVNKLDECYLCPFIIIDPPRSLNLLDLLQDSDNITCCPKETMTYSLDIVVRMAIRCFHKMQTQNTKYKKALKDLENVKFIERAKGVLMEREQLDENEVHQRLRTKSMKTRMSMRALAETILKSGMVEKKRR
jgi:hypothetical protein